MFKLDILDYIEFEKLSKDIMKKKTNKEFERYASGPDGGIDLRSLDKTIICQCKRYSQASKLLEVLKKEVPKVEKLKPEKYYVLTTVELSVRKKDEIYDLFKDYMDDTSFIISGIDIQDFLSDNDNIDVLKNNIKLWLSSTNILELFMNKYVNNIESVTLENIKNDTKYFVETNAYRKALNIINTNDILLINGMPGIGKSITSRMIIRALIANNNNYKIRTASSNSLDELIKSISDNDDLEIIYIDDFLGQTMMDISDDKIKKLKDLFYLIRKNKNKKLIINSRITILNKAMKENVEFEKLLIELNINRCLIDLDEITSLDKARILYNLMKNNNISLEGYISIVSNKNYNKIINHSSFSPRIIEMCCMRYKKETHGNFYDYLIASLDFPNDIWKDEFNKLYECDSIIMYLLYLLGDNYIPYSVLKESFYAYCEKNNVHLKPTYSFDDSLNRLCDSMLGVVVINKKMYLSVLNPSINDYIQNDLYKNSEKVKPYLNACIYLEQLKKTISFIRIDKIENFDRLKTYTKPYELIKSDDEKKIDFIVAYNYLDIELKAYVKNLFNRGVNPEYLLKLLLYKSTRDYYELNKELLDFETHIKDMKEIGYKDLLHLLRLFHSHGMDVLKIIDDNKEIITKSVVEYINNQILNSVYDTVFCEDAEVKYDFTNEYEVNPEYVDMVESKLTDFFDKYYCEVVHETKEYIEFDPSELIDETECLSDIDVYDIIENDKEDSLSYIFKEEQDENDDDVDMVFERYYDK